MKIHSPARAGDTSHGEFGQLPIPHPDSGGYFGGAKASVVNSGNTRCEQRQRTDPSTGMLANAGGLVFYGSRDRPFYAVNQLTGQTLWIVRLNGVPSGRPISFTAGDAALPVKPMCTGADRAAAPCLAAIELGNQLQLVVIERIESAIT